MGVNNLLGAKGMFIEGQTLLEAYPNLDGLWSLINLMANTSFVFLPALVGWSAAKRFGGSEILGIVLGLMLVHPDLLNAWNYGKAVAGLDGQSLPYFDILGLFQIEKVGYQGQILPILLAAYVMSVIENGCGRGCRTPFNCWWCPSPPSSSPGCWPWRSSAR
jgi:PTS system trehalose-specific IIC component